MPNYWMVRAGRHGSLFNKFKSDNIIAIHYPEIGNVSDKTEEEIRAEVVRGYPNDSNQQRGSVIGTHRTFCLRMKLGDGVVTRVPDAREYLLGAVAGKCQYQDKIAGYRHYRSVKWNKKTVSRDSLSGAVKNSLGGLNTIFQIQDDHWKEIFAQLSPGTKSQPQTDADETDALVAMDLKGKIKQRVEDKIDALGWEQMEHLVAALLRAMGYRTQMTPKGGDGGFDIYASPDGLMFKEPRIRAEVKHRKGKMDVKDIQKLLSAKRGARGLYVSTGGFKSGALDVARREEITTLNLEQLTEQVIEHYDNFDAEGRKLLPMQKLYLPVSD